MASVSIDNVSKAYGAQRVLHDVSIDVPDGAFVVLVGPSGCGKSTLLRMVAGLEEISGGAVRIDGKVVNDLPPKARDISMVFQNYALYPHMSVAENMAFSLTLAGASPAAKAQAVARAAGILGLTELLDRRPKQLSGGQRQRVAMGRAIVRDPKVFLFDEPLSNLDAKLRVQMRAEIKALHHRLGATVLYVTHDQVEAMTMADRIVVMNAGRVEQIGRPLDLYDRPDTLFVASFIGSPAMNLVSGAVLRGRAGADLRLGDGACLPLGPAPAGLPDGNLVCGIRPEHLDLVAREDGVPAQVEAIEPTGAETLLTLTVGATRFTAAVRERVNLSIGAGVHLRLRQDSLLFFDPSSGLRISPPPQRPARTA